MRPKSPAAAHDILPHARLGLVHAQRGRIAQWRPVKVPVKALFVHAVSRLVDRRKEGGLELVGKHAGGEPHVRRRERGREWMGGLVLPPVLKVEAQGLDHLDAKVPLLVHVELLGKEGVVDRVLPLGDGLDQGHQPLLHLPKQGFHLRGFHPRFEPFQQGVIYSIFIAPSLCFLDRQLQDLFQVGLKLRKVGRLSGLLPGLVGQGGGPAQLGDQFARQFALAIVLPLRHADHAGLKRVIVGVRQLLFQILQ